MDFVRYRKNMKALAILSCIGYALSYSSYNPYDENIDYTDHLRGGHQGHSRDNFLSGLSQKALSEYFKIVQRTSQTISEVEKSLQRWAKKYGVEDKYSASVEEQKRLQEEFERSVNKLMKALTTYFREYTKLGKNKRITMDSLLRKNQALFNKLDGKQKEIASFIMQKYLTNVEGIRGGDGGCSGDCGGFLENNEEYPGNYRGFQEKGLSGSNEGFLGSNGGSSENFGGLSGNNGMHGIIGVYNGNGPTFSPGSSFGNNYVVENRGI
uniref:DUF148 domain-containing protein n=1 Tax=Angiostrongylus cantonensis TaxID=6313 RepID=A0A0K0DCV3_ANGCA